MDPDYLPLAVFVTGFLSLIAAVFYANANNPPPKE